MKPKNYREEDIIMGARAGLYLARYIEDRESMVEAPKKKIRLELPDEKSIIDYFNKL